MTEYLMNKSDTNDWASLGASVIWDESIQMLLKVRTIVDNNRNAFIWWYISCYYSFIGDGSQDASQGAVLKEGMRFSFFKICWDRVS